MSIGKIARKKIFAMAFLALVGFCLGLSQSAMAASGVGYVGPVTVDTRGTSSSTTFQIYPGQATNVLAGSVYGQSAYDLLFDFSSLVASLDPPYTLILHGTHKI